MAPPALLPAEVTVDPDMLQQYQLDMEKAAQEPLPEEEDADL